MNDFRVERFLDEVAKDLTDFFPQEAAEERLREMRGHLNEAIEEHREAGAPDPIAVALAEFGHVDTYRKNARTAANGTLNRFAEREVILWATLTLLVPIALDLAMDAASWFRGSDSTTAPLSLPAALYCGYRLFQASRKTQFLPLKLTAVVAASFFAFLLVGGWTRAKSYGYESTQARGTALRRMKNLEGEGLPGLETKLARLQLGTQLFAAQTPPLTMDGFRTANGYLVPSTGNLLVARVGRSPNPTSIVAFGQAWYPVTTYAEAHAIWNGEASQIIAWTQKDVDDHRKEIRELHQVVASPWQESVRTELPHKFDAAWLTLLCLTGVHGLGVATGALTRLRRRRRLA